MVYVSLKESITGPKQVCLSDIADVLDTEDKLDATKIAFTPPQGVLSGMDVLRKLQQEGFSNVHLYGAHQVVIEPPEQTLPLVKLIKSVAICIFLFLGAGMAITYFHADVDMPGALESLRNALSRDANFLWAAIPYGLGVGAGALFFLLPRGIPPPLVIKERELTQKLSAFKAESVLEPSPTSPPPPKHSMRAWLRYWVLPQSSTQHKHAKKSKKP